MCPSSQLREGAFTSTMSLLWLRKSPTPWPTECSPVCQTVNTTA